MNLFFVICYYYRKQVIFLSHMMYIKMHRQNCVYNYLFILYGEFRVAGRQIKFCSSCQTTHKAG